MSSLRRPIAIALGAMLLLTVACSEQGSSTDTTSPSTDGDTITIAVEGPISGSQNATGLDMARAAQLAVDEANANGGVAGKQVNLIRLDDAADAEQGVEVANQAVEQGAFAVIGPYNSSVGIENLPIYLEGNVIPVHLTSSADTDGMGYTVQPKDYQVAPIEADAIQGFFKAKRVAILYDRSSYTAGIAKALKSDLEEDGVEVVANLRFNEKNLVPGNTIRRAMQGDPDLIYSSTYFPQGGRLAPLIARQKDVTCFMGLANQDPQFVEIAGLEASQACQFSGVPSPDQFPGAADYVTAYEAKFGEAPGTWGTFTYDSVNLLFDAVEQSEGWNADAVNDYLSTTDGFEGATGTITIDTKTGNRVDVPVVVLNVSDDSQFVIDPKWAKFAKFGG